MTEADAPVSFRVGPYVAFEKIAAGGMGAVYLGRLEGASGFSRVVVLKRLHSHVPGAASVLRDEARLTARVRHPNVVTMLDVVERDDELVLVMDYVEGCSLAELLEARRVLPPKIASAIVLDVLAGLGSAHAARAEDGTPLDLVHRDVSPQNVLIGVDGIARLTDFGLAKARGRLVKTTTEGELKGKFAYMAPEQVEGRAVGTRADLYAAAAILFECLTGRRLHEGDEPGLILTSILFGEVPDVRGLVPDLPSAIEETLKRALALDPDLRHANATELAGAVEDALGRATPTEVAALLRDALPETLAARADKRNAIEKPMVAPAKPAPLDGAPAIAAPAPRRVRRVVFGVLAIAVVAAAFFVARRRMAPSPPATDVASASPAPMRDGGAVVTVVEPPPGAPDAPIASSAPPSPRAPLAPRRPPSVSSTSARPPPAPVTSSSVAKPPLAGIPDDRDPTGP